MNQKPSRKSRQKQHNGSAFIIQTTSLYPQSRFQKSAQTPFERIRRKQKIRKERIYFSLTPTKQDFSLMVGKQSNQSQEKNRKEKSCKTDREEVSPSRFRLTKEGNYRVVIRDTSKKKTSFQTTPQKIDEPQRRLVIEGANCGSDLIAANRQKLEQMIAQIKANNAALHQKYDISELVLQKGKYTRQRQNPKRIIKEEVLPSFSSECKTKPIDSRQYLICTPAVLQATKNELSIEGSSVMIDGFSKWEKVFALTPKQIELSRKICKTQEISNSQSPRNLRKHSPSKKGPIFNGFNLHSLKGWDSSDQLQDSFFHMAIH